MPVPVYYPDATEILGARVYRRVADVPGDIDIVDVFRRAARRARARRRHPRQAPARRLAAIGHPPRRRSAERFAEAGILVVQERCLMVDWQHYARR